MSLQIWFQEDVTQRLLAIHEAANVKGMDIGAAAGFTLALRAIALSFGVSLPLFGASEPVVVDGDTQIPLPPQTIRVGLRMVAE